MLNDFDFDLPKHLISQYPVKRGSSRLLYRHSNGKFVNMIFDELYDTLRENDVLVLNNTRVLASCLTGELQNNSKIKINLISQDYNDLNLSLSGCNYCIWRFLSKPRKKAQLNTIIKFDDVLFGTVIAKYTDYDIIQFDNSLNLSQQEFYDKINTIGQMPLPPYMKRYATEEDKLLYQTVFSSVEGSVAAPTAGLHFSNELLSKLQHKGVKIAYITLHIGGGTFLPIRSKNIDDHIMHGELYSIDKQTCNMINEAKQNNYRIIAVGTTVTRALESAANFCNNKLTPHARYTDIFIKHQYDFKIVNCLITNFHLPKSTLFILICTFLNSIQNAKELYIYAIENQYKFYSYGDACFLER